MKRFVLLTAVLLLSVLVLVACDQGTETTEPIETTTVTTTSGSSSEAEKLQEEINEYKALMKKDIARAETIANATVEKYGRDLGGFGYTLAHKYNTKTDSKVGTASVWGYTAYYAMINRLIDVTEKNSTANKTFEKLSNTVYTGFRNYEGTGTIKTYLGSREETMYGVNRAGIPGKANIEGDQAVYDDQMWIIRETIYRYQQTGDEKYFNEARRLADICILGWDYTLDKNGKEYGGIPWGPSYASKHTCSNAPIIKPLVEIYEILKAKDSRDADYYLDWAKKIYTFARTQLKLSNNLYGDLLGSDRKEITGSNGKLQYVTTAQGRVNDITYSYNTGAMISGGAALYKATGETSYLKEAEASARSAYNSFCKTNSYAPFYPNNTETVWFNLVLLQGFLDLYEFNSSLTSKMIQSFQKMLDYAFTKHQKDGFLPRDMLLGWYKHSDEASKKYDEESNAMDQVSYAQIYAMLALWHADRIEALEAELALLQ